MTMTVNEAIRALKSAVDPQDRDYVNVRLVIHSEDGSSAGYALTTSGGTGYPFINIVAETERQ